MTPRERRDILPENNEGYFLIPQILTNQAEDFLKAAGELENLGYREVNLNLGCPSGTVVAKRKGAGFLEYPGELDRFLEKIFSGCSLDISIKTRIGKEDAGEFETLLKIYNRYPLKELIVHPRVQRDYYKNHPNLEAYALAVRESKNPLCYNGDLFTPKAAGEILEGFPKTQTLMLGRGLLRNPCLVREMKGEETLNREKLREFHDALCREYQMVMSGDRNVLFKMKELWFYMGDLFPENKKYMKKIKKAQNLSQYQEALEELFENCAFDVCGGSLFMVS